MTKSWGTSYWLYVFTTTSLLRFVTFSSLSNGIFSACVFLITLEEGSFFSLSRRVQIQLQVTSHRNDAKGDDERNEKRQSSWRNHRGGSYAWTGSEFKESLINKQLRVINNANTSLYKSCKTLLWNNWIKSNWEEIKLRLYHESRKS